MKFKQHVPNFVDRVDPYEQEFSSLEELLNIDVVKEFKSHKDFHQYSLSGGKRLMAECDNGYCWWVIGYISEPIEGLPEWVAKYDEEKKAKENEAKKLTEKVNKEFLEKEKNRVKNYLH